MKRNRFQILLLAFLALFAGGCDWQKCGICGVGKWITFSPPNGKFSVLMPASPTFTIKTTDTKFGPISMDFYQAAALKEHRFAVVYNAYPPKYDLSDVDKTFEQMEGNVLKNGFQVITRTNISLNGILGRELVCQSDKYSLGYRLFLHERDAYQVMTIMPKDSNCDKHIREFMNSFHVN